MDIININHIMTPIDWPPLINWLVSGAIGLIFGSLGGVITAYISYVAQRKRDDIAWSREKEKTQQQFQHEAELLKSGLRQDLAREKEQLVRSDILPTMWKKLQEALGRIDILFPFIGQDPNLDTWPEEMLKEFVEKSRFSEFHKQQLMGADNKLDFYRNTIYWYELDDARKAMIEFHNYLVINKIFLGEELYACLAETDKFVSYFDNFLVN